MNPSGSTAQLRPWPAPTRSTTPPGSSPPPWYSTASADPVPPGHTDAPAAARTRPPGRKSVLRVSGGRGSSPPNALRPGGEGGAPELLRDGGHLRHLRFRARRDHGVGQNGHDHEQQTHDDGGHGGPTGPGTGGRVGEHQGQDGEEYGEQRQAASDQ